MRAWLIIVATLFFAGCASVPRPASVTMLGAEFLKNMWMTKEG
jgi:uncharacterized lipoprotein YmbA